MTSINAEWFNEAMLAIIEGIVRQASEDYRLALRAQHQGMIKECERFFLGKYFAGLTNLDGKAVIRDIRRELEVLETNEPAGKTWL